MRLPSWDLAHIVPIIGLIWNAALTAGDPGPWGLFPPHPTSLEDPPKSRLGGFPPTFVGNISAVPEIALIAQTAEKPWFEVSVEPPRLQGVRVAYLEDFGVSPDKPDNTDAFMDAVKSCTAGVPCYVTFRSGGSKERPGPTFRFGGGTMGAALLVADLTDFVFDGAWNRLLFSRPNWTSIGIGWNDWMCTPKLKWEAAARKPVWRDSLIVLDNVQRSYVGRFSMDWDYDLWPLSSLVQVVEASESGWTLKFVDWPKEVNGGRVNISMLLGFRVLTAVDPVTGYFGVQGGDEYYPPQGGFSSITHVDDTTLRLEFARKANKSPEPSTTNRYLLRHFAYDAHGFWISNCTDCTFDSITVNAVPGKFVVANDGSRGLQFSNIEMKMAPLPNTATLGNRFFKRYLTSASDGIFVSGTGPNIAIRNVGMENVGDDCVNIHDLLAVDTSDPEKEYALNATGPFTPASDLPWSVDLSDPTILIVRANHFAPFAAGDPISFVSPVTMLPVFSASLVRVGTDGCGDWALVFNTSLPTVFYNTTTGRWLPFAPFLWNTRHTARNVLIDSLSCVRTRARGLLIHTPDTIVSNSRIAQTAMACMFVRSDLTEREGRGIQHLGVYGNAFEGCDRYGWNAGGLDFHVWGMASPGRVGMRDVGVRGNVLWVHRVSYRELPWTYFPRFAYWVDICVG